MIDGCVSVLIRVEFVANERQRETERVREKSRVGQKKNDKRQRKA